MMKWHALCVQEAFQSSDLINDHGRQLLRRHLDLSSPESLDVGEAWMGADCDVVFLAGSDGLLHYDGVAGVKAAGYVCVVDERD